MRALDLAGNRRLGGRGARALAVAAAAGALDELRVLRLRDCGLRALPAALLPRLRRLRTLDLGDNPGLAVPGGVGALRALEELDLRGCHLPALPDGALQLPRLTRLRVDEGERRRSRSRSRSHSSAQVVSLDMELGLPGSDSDSASDFGGGDSSWAARGAAHAPATDWALSVWVIFLLLGVGALLPWNVAIQASGYFEERFCGSPFESDFLSWFGAAFNAAQVLGLVASLRWLARVSLYRQVVWPLCVCAAAQLVMLVFVGVPGVGGSALFELSLLLVFVSGASAAVLQGGVFGLAAKLPDVYTNALMSGIAFAGFGVSLSSVVTIASAGGEGCDVEEEDEDEDEGCHDYTDVDAGSLAYFSIALLTLLACVAAYFALVRHPAVAARVAGFASVEADGALLQEAQATASRVSVFRAARRCVFNVWLAYAVTLSVYPAVTATVASTAACPAGAGGLLANELWAPVGFAVFNLCDLGGRLLAAAWQLPDRAVTRVALLRAGFVPCFLLSNVPGSALGAPLASDGLFFVLMVLFAVSGGWVASLAMMRGPQTCAHPLDQQTAGQMMALALTCGLTAGSVLSFGTVSVLG